MTGCQRRRARAVGGDPSRPAPAAQTGEAGAGLACLRRSKLLAASSPNGAVTNVSHPLTYTQSRVERASKRSVERSRCRSEDSSKGLYVLSSMPPPRSEKAVGSGTVPSRAACRHAPNIGAKRDGEQSSRRDSESTREGEADSLRWMPISVKSRIFPVSQNIFWCSGARPRISQVP